MTNRSLLSLDKQKCFETRKESLGTRSDPVMLRLLSIAFRTWFSAARSIEPKNTISSQSGRWIPFSHVLNLVGKLIQTFPTCGLIFFSDDKSFSLVCESFVHTTVFVCTLIVKGHVKSIFPCHLALSFPYPCTDLFSDSAPTLGNLFNLLDRAGIRKIRVNIAVSVV